MSRTRGIEVSLKAQESFGRREECSQDRRGMRKGVLAGQYVIHSEDS